MMIISFPRLDVRTFIPVREHLHKLAGVLGDVRAQIATPVPSYEHLALEICDEGFAIPETNGLRIVCDVTALALIATRNENQRQIPLNGLTLSQGRDALVQHLHTLGTDITLSNESEDVIIDSQSPKEIRRAFVAQLVSFNALLRAFHGTLDAARVTNVNLWPHHFDNSFIWYSGRTIGTEIEQIGIGVSNGDSSYALPYVYMTPWPLTNNIAGITVGRGGHMHTEEWTGAVLPYDALMQFSDRESGVASFFRDTFNAFARAFENR